MATSLLIGCSRKSDQSMDNNQGGEMCNIETGICSPIEKSSDKVQSRVKNTNVLNITYYYDPLCGWCYGFSKVVSQLTDHYGDSLNLNIVSGGLFTGNRVGLVNNIAPYIKAGAYRSVESTTGVKFGDAFLDDINGNGKIELNSVPPSIAFCIVKEAYPDHEIDFAKTLLDAVYRDGANPSDLDAYKPYIDAIGMDWQKFISKMGQTKYLEMAQAEFNTFRKSGLGGMPSLVMYQDDNAVLLTNGYATFQSLKLKIASAMD